MTPAQKLFSKAELARDPRLPALVESHDKWMYAAKRLSLLHTDAHIQHLHTRLRLSRSQLFDARRDRALCRFYAAWSILACLTWTTSSLHSPDPSPLLAPIVGVVMMGIYTMCVRKLFIAQEVIPDMEQFHATVETALNMAKENKETMILMNTQPMNGMLA